MLTAFRGTALPVRELDHSDSTDPIRRWLPPSSQRMRLPQSLRWLRRVVSWQSRRRVSDWCSARRLFRQRVFRARSFSAAALDVLELGFGGVASVVGAEELAPLFAIGIALMLAGATVPGLEAFACCRARSTRCPRACTRKRPRLRRCSRGRRVEGFRG